MKATGKLKTILLFLFAAVLIAGGLLLYCMRFTIDNKADETFVLNQNPTAEGVVITAAADKKNITVMVDNQSAGNIDLFPNSPSFALYKQEADGWHGIVHRNFTGKNINVFQAQLKAGEAKTFTLDLFDEFGFFPPSGSYVLRISYYTDSVSGLCSNDILLELH